MDRYIAFDAHDESCTAVVVGPSGKQLTAQVLETNGAAVVQFLRTVPGCRHVALEEGALSQWLYELIEPHVDDVVVAVADKSSGQKNDLEDAKRLAESLRLGAIKQPVYKIPRSLAELRCAIRGYRFLSQDVVRSKQRLKSVFRSRGIVSEAELYSPKRRGPLLRRLPAAERGLASRLAEELDALSVILKNQQKHLEQVADTNADVKLLMTAPGIGLIRASTIVAIIGTPNRFRTSRQLWNYCGLGVVFRTSSDWVREGGRWMRVPQRQSRGLNRNRNPWLKSVFKSAATGLIAKQPDHPLSRDYQRAVESGSEPNLAKLTLARRLAAIVLAMWKHKEEYDPGKHTPKTAG